MHASLGGLAVWPSRHAATTRPGPGTVGGSPLCLTVTAELTQTLLGLDAARTVALPITDPAPAPTRDGVPGRTWVRHEVGDGSERIG